MTLLYSNPKPQFHAVSIGAEPLSSAMPVERYETGTVVYVQEQGREYELTINPATLIKEWSARSFSGDNALEREQITVAIGGQTHVKLPIGTFISPVTACSLEVDTGSGYVALEENTDWIRLERGRPGEVLSQPPASVVDAYIGYQLTSPAAGGETYRFRWVERFICIPPGVPMAVGVDGPAGGPWTLNTTNYWQTGAGSTTQPLGIVIPSLEGCVAEFWRRSRKLGGLRNLAQLVGQPSYGKRWIPYTRGPSGNTDPWLYHYRDFAGHPGGAFFPAPEYIANRKYLFKVCYYNPSTGARSALSQYTITVIRRIDRANNSTILHNNPQVFIQY